MRTAFGAALGLGAIASLVIVVRASSVIEDVSGALTHLPLVLMCEGGVVACETWALWRLYGEKRAQLSFGTMVQVGLVGYPPMVLVPAGRAVAEAVRAGFLARLVGGPLAAAIAVEMQALVLIAIAGICVPCAVSMHFAGGAPWLVGAIVGNGILAAVIAFGMLAIARHTRLGAWFARHFKALGDGNRFDEELRDRPSLPAAAVVSAIIGRLFQCAELGLLFHAMVGSVDIHRAFAVEGIHLIGASIGDLIPAQLGASDATFTFAGPMLGLTASGALALALLAHATQAFWSAVGAIVSLGVVARRVVPAEPQ